LRFFFGKTSILTIEKFADGFSTRSKKKLLYISISDSKTRAISITDDALVIPFISNR